MGTKNSHLSVSVEVSQMNSLLEYIEISQPFTFYPPPTSPRAFPLCLFCFVFTWVCMAGECNSVIDHVPSIYQALGLSSNITKRKTNKQTKAGYVSLQKLTCSSLVCV